MTEILFYTFAGEPLDVARRLAAKAYGQGRRVMLYAPDPGAAEAIDRLLWTVPALGFVPHCRDTDALAAETPLLIGANPEVPAQADVLINLDPALPPAFARYERLVEIVGEDDASRERGRERYRFYQARGYALTNHDLRRRAA